MPEVLWLNLSKKQAVSIFQEDSLLCMVMLTPETSPTKSYQATWFETTTLTASENVPVCSSFIL